MWHQRLKVFVKKSIFMMPVAVAFLDCVAYVAKVEGVSMQPALNAEGVSKDFVLLNRWIIRTGEVNRGDVVAIISPKDPGQKLIKRVIALEGDTIRTLGYKKKYVTIPRGHCWLEGDHHDKSLDSNNFGPVALGLVVARASHIVWPPSRWSRIDCDMPEGREPVKGSPFMWLNDYTTVTFTEDD